MTSTTARRALLGSVVAGGLVATQVAPSSAAPTAWSPQSLKVTDVKVGDLVIGPDGNAARLAAVTKLSTGRVKVDATDPRTGSPVPLDATASAGFPNNRKLIVLARGVAGQAVVFPAQPEPGRVIDGGGP